MQVMKTVSTVILGLFAVSAAPIIAHAQARAAIGTLTCTGGKGVGLVLGSQKSYTCSFDPTDGGPRQSYTAQVTKIGLDIGVTGNTVMVWTVLAASQSTRAGMLRGQYTGASADAAVGIGGGAKLLIGGSSKSIVLQPVSIQGQTGVNLAVGIASMTVR